MNVKQIQTGTQDFRKFKQYFRNHLRNEYYNNDRETKKTLLFGRYDSNELTAVAIFQPYTEPTLHMGSMISANAYRDIHKFEDVAIYVIRLIYAFKNKNRLAESAAALIRACEDYLLERFGACCLMISLFQTANKKAFPHYSNLGFVKKDNSDSYHMSIDLTDLIRRYPKTQRLQSPVVLKSIQTMTMDDFARLVECYKNVFAPDIPLDAIHDQLKVLMSKSSFAADLSMLICETSPKRQVVGFCFFEQKNTDSLYVSAMGVREDFRKGMDAAKLFCSIAKNCYQRGYGHATLITSSKRLYKVIARVLGATHLDTLNWHIKCNLKDA